ncbi:hypothetical protein CIB84_011030, partial [Bambusicola thoracicus]
PCQPCSPKTLNSSSNDPRVRQYQNSNTGIKLSSVMLILPEPILSFFPQSTVLGSSTSTAAGSILS